MRQRGGGLCGYVNILTLSPLPYPAHQGQSHTRMSGQHWQSPNITYGANRSSPYKELRHACFFVSPDTSDQICITTLVTHYVLVLII